jgi:hypothetical protein
VSTDEDTAVLITLEGTDPEDDPLIFAIETLPSNGSVSCTGAEGADCTYTPDANFNGTDSFTFTASDSAPAVSEAATITIEIGALNDEPTADSQEVVTDEDVAFDITLTGTDPDEDPLTYTIVDPPA